MPPKKSQKAKAKAQAKVSVDMPSGPPVETVGVKRPGYGNAGRALAIRTNHFVATIPEGIIYHYDVVILPAEKSLPQRLNFEIIKTLQDTVAPAVFTPKASYDGRKNLYAPQKLRLGANDFAEFEVPISTSQERTKTYKLQLQKVAEINPETLARYLEGKQSLDSTVTTAITAISTALRMEPNLKFPFNVRSFFTPEGKRPLGSGLEVWRGFFQSARPSLGRMLINVDISSALMYKPGPLSQLCLEYLGESPRAVHKLSAGMDPRIAHRLQQFLMNVRVNVPGGRTVTIRKLGSKASGEERIILRDEQETSVKEYLENKYSLRLQHPQMICVLVGKTALIPIELCTVVEGQFFRRQVPPEKVKSVLEFSTMKPSERFRAIEKSLTVLGYGQSEYLRQFVGVNGDASGLLKINGRVLPPPALVFGGANAKGETPRDGAWNMNKKKLFQPATVQAGWCFVIFERQNVFSREAFGSMVEGLTEACKALGIGGVRANDSSINTFFLAPQQQSVLAIMEKAGSEFVAKNKKPPSIFVTVMPEGSSEIKLAIKHFGNIQRGIATQCVRSNKASFAKIQYWSNVGLKINVKLGGINVVPETRSVPFLMDVNNPTMVIGADVIHPPPGTKDRPSFTSMVASVDKFSSRYVATTRAQVSGQEMISDFEEMAEHLIKLYVEYRTAREKPAKANPSRIIFYRDGVSEGQFQMVLDQEVSALKKACENAKISPMPKITTVVVTKRHHVRLEPQEARDADRSGNCPAGTVLDQSITSPVLFDFFIQSQQGLLGTSRPAKYSVLLDDNKFTPDALQQLSFALCHVYAPSTRSISIPAPVFYADRVCMNAKFHYHPNEFKYSDDVSSIAGSEGARPLEEYRKAFKPIHPNMQKLMYFA